jgi:hypothetical protein
MIVAGCGDALPSRKQYCTFSEGQARVDMMSCDVL